MHLPIFLSEGDVNTLRIEISLFEKEGMLIPKKNPSDIFYPILHLSQFPSDFFSCISPAKIPAKAGIMMSGGKKIIN